MVRNSSFFFVSVLYSFHLVYSPFLFLIKRSSFSSTFQQSVGSLPCIPSANVFQIIQHRIRQMTVIHTGSRYFSYFSDGPHGPGIPTTVQFRWHPPRFTTDPASDLGVGSDSERTDDFCSCAYHNVVFQSRVPLARFLFLPFPPRVTP